MTTPPRSRFVAFAVVTYLAVSSAGCGGSGEGVHSYRVARATEKAAAAPAEGGEFRILGAMYPADNPAWFFKLAGPAAEVAKFEADFDKLAATVRLPAGGAVPEFTLPTGWVRGGPRDGFVRVDETLKPPGSALEVTVIQSAGGREKNLGRWVDQVGQSGPPDKFTRVVQAAGTSGLRVDVTGPKNPVSAPMKGRTR